MDEERGACRGDHTTGVFVTERKEHFCDHHYLTFNFHQGAAGAAPLKPEAEGLFRVQYRVRHTLWFQDPTDKLKKRLLVCASIRKARFRWIDAILE